MQTYGYVRVSSRDQNEERQMIALKEFPVVLENIFIDKQSGKDFERPEYQRLLQKLQKDDVVVVKSIDRLGRNYEDILTQWKYLTKEIEADVVILDMPLLDTRQRRDLVGTVIADIVLQLLSYVAESERENIRQRQAEGIQAAREKGVTFGRPIKISRKRFERAREKEMQGLMTQEELLKKLKISKSTYMRYLQRYEK